MSEDEMDDHLMKGVKNPICITLGSPVSDVRVNVSILFRREGDCTERPFLAWV